MRTLPIGVFCVCIAGLCVPFQVLSTLHGVEPGQTGVSRFIDHELQPIWRLERLRSTTTCRCCTDLLPASTHTCHAVYIATTSPCVLILCGGGRIISSVPKRDEEIVVVIAAELHRHTHTHTHTHVHVDTCTHTHTHTHMPTHVQTHFLPTSFQRHEAEGLKFKSAAMLLFGFLLQCGQHHRYRNTHSELAVISAFGGAKDYCNLCDVVNSLHKPPCLAKVVIISQAHVT